MGKEFEIAYIPVGVGTFHLESARQRMDESAALLRSLAENVRVPAEMLLTTEQLDQWLEELDPDLIVFQNLTFANGAYMSRVLARFDCPLLLWTLREPVIDGTRLRLNSLTGAFSAANAIKAFRDEPFEYLLGDPAEEAARHKVAAVIAAARARYDMLRLRLAAVGHTPQGFGFGRALDLEMRKTFGVELLSVEARELMDRARTCPAEEMAACLADAEARTVGLAETPAQNREDFARLYWAYRTFAEENRIGALASRCWPDFFTDYGTPVCAVLGILNDLGIASSCEADTYGALSMYLCARMTGGPAFFGDPVSVDEAENSVTFWHCGMAPCSLAREDTGAAVGEHCNRHLGPTLEFGCRPSEAATVFRIGRRPDGSFRFFIAEGEALDRPKQFYGTSVVVGLKADAGALIRRSVEEGWEPHFAVAYGDIADELEILARMLGVDCVRA